MTIKAPNWCEHAIPGANGWEDPDTGEVFASTKFTPEQVAEFYGKAAPAAPEPVVQMLQEAPAHSSIDSMSKLQLEALGRQHGIELDRRQSKKSLLEKMKVITAPK
jgi:hypothetical protein